MKLKFIPFSLVSINQLKKGSKIFMPISLWYNKKFKSLKLNIKHARLDVNEKDYFAMCLYSSLIFFILVGLTFTVLLSMLKSKGIITTNVFTSSFIITLILTFFVFLQQLNYPKLLKNRRLNDLEKNLLHALRNVLVQVSAGVPLFNILANIANSNFGEISNEFKMAVKEISAGVPEADALKNLTMNNPSTYFRRAMWQLSNGMKSGSDIGQVLQEIISTISEEQLVQIKTYGSELNPIAMFYMLLTVIVPALSITFLIILSSFLSFSENLTKALLLFLYSIVTFIQLMFLGIIKAKRPTLMGD
ncbi:type II secretion system F family protein [Candidatus Woesearchaeota archaeon]|nr:MAG: type II secretion system F family protein [Candidatus Woesearchaeota archaeon]